MLTGIFPVIPTLFAENDSLDLAAQRKVVHFALAAGAQGIVFPGVASEYNFLTPTERGQLMAIVAEEVDGRVPIVGGASAATTEEVIAAGQQALVHGIDRLMIMTPHGLDNDLPAHREFFLQVSSNLTGVQIILQNAPQPIGAGLNADAIAELAAAVPAITYVKEETLPSGPAITAVIEARIPHLQGVFGGGGARYIIDELNRGAVGAMPAVELIDLHVALYEAFAKNDHDRARQLYRLGLPLLVSQAVFRMRLTKYVLSQRGVAHALNVRAPLPELDEFTKRGIDLMLADLQTEFSLRLK